MHNTITVATILKRKGSSVYSIDPDADLRKAASVLSDHNIGALLVTGKGEKLLGIISERDIVRMIARGASTVTPVRDAMTAQVHTCSKKDNIAELMQVMTERRIRHLPVLEDDAVIGLVSVGDVVKNHIAEVEEEAELLRSFISQ